MEPFEKAFYRERAARELAEDSLESKSRELYYAHEELVQKQNQLIISEKMASIGLISAGIAHEINNPLSFILSNLNTLDEYFQEIALIVDGLINLGIKANQNQTSMSPENLKQQFKEFLDLKNYNYLIEDINSLLDESRIGIGRIRDIVKSLKGVSHSQLNQPQEINLNDHLQVVLNVIRPQIKDKSTVHTKFSPLPLIKCYPDQLSQVFMNLLVNAYQAMDNKGEITIETCCVNNGIEVKVSDTGCGITPENMKKLFTPFFTTKPIGQGTGLGLSISYDIIKAHGGTIAVESYVNQGTTFTLWLPLSVSVAQAANAAKKEKAS